MVNAKRFFVCLLVTGLSLSSAVAGPVNLLSNPGFETGDLTGWAVGGPNGGFGVLTDGSPLPGISHAPLLPAYQNSRGGVYGAYAIVAAGNGEYVSFSQTVDLLPGTHTAGFYMGHDEGSLFGIGGAIATGGLGIWVDGTQIPFNSSYANNFSPGSGPDDFTLFDADFVSAGGPTTVEFRVSGSGTVRAGISVDDFVVLGEAASDLPAVPVPNTLALVGMGAVLVTHLRRRRSL